MRGGLAGAGHKSTAIETGPGVRNCHWSTLIGLPYCRACREQHQNRPEQAARPVTAVLGNRRVGVRAAGILQQLLRRDHHPVVSQHGVYRLIIRGAALALPWRLQTARDKACNFAVDGGLHVLQYVPRPANGEPKSGTAAT